MDRVTTRQDRTVGIAALVLAVVAALVPDFQLAGQPIDTHLIAWAWFLAAILLLSMGSAVLPKPKLIRWGAAILFVTAPAAPFLANLIDQSLGA